MIKKLLLHLFLTKQERIIFNALIQSRFVQEYIWGRLSQGEDGKYNIQAWLHIFQKRLDKVAEIRQDHPSAQVELRKRVLQQAALSIRALEVLDEKCLELK